jgi:hypothetical protein
MKNTELKQLLNIERLVVTENCLQELSEDLCVCKTLNIKNSTEKLYAKILQMQNLKVLMIENKNIKTLPEWICKLSKLEFIRLHDDLIVLSDAQYDWFNNLLKNDCDIDGLFMDSLFPEYLI